MPKHFVKILVIILTSISFDVSAYVPQEIDTLPDPKILLDLASQSLNNPDKMQTLSVKALNLVRQQENTYSKGKAYQLIGWALYLKNQYSPAIDSIQRAIPIFIYLRDSLEIGRSYNIIGICYQRKLFYSNALEYFQKSLSYQENLPDKSYYGSTLNNIGIVYRLIGQYEKSLDYYLRSYEVFCKFEDPKKIATIENNIGILNNSLGKHEEALRWLFKPINSMGEHKDTVILATSYQNVANVYSSLNDFPKTLEYNYKSLELKRHINDRHGMAIDYLSIGDIYLKTGDFRKAFVNLKECKSIAEQDEDNNTLKECYKLLSDYYMKIGDMSQSCEMLNKYSRLLETAFNDNITRRIAELSVAYETEHKEQQNKLLQANLEIERIKVKRTNAFQIFYIIIIILALIIILGSIAMIYKLRVKNREIKKYNDDLKRFNQELESLVITKTADLRSALQKAQESDKLKTAFLANMSHEVRTPMNGILGFAKVLEGENLSVEERKQYVEIINRQGHNLLQIINDIINISKIESGQLEVRASAFNLNRMMKDLNSLFSSAVYQHSKRKVELRFIKSFSDDLSFIITDPIRLEQILINLIDNAFKFTEEGYVEVGYQLDDPQTLRFYVKDTGIGIPSSEQEKIFERFYRYNDGNVQYKGTGLGLSISMGIANLLGGDIRVESELHKGSVFSLYLPYIPSHPPLGENGSIVNIRQTPESWKGKVILIVEDDLFSYQYIEALLTKTGVRIIHVKNGEDAVEACHLNRSINLVLMDMMLPFMSGYQAVKEIRSFWKELPVIAQTANVMNNDKSLCIDAGCNDYISKPIDPDELFMMIHKYIDRGGY